MTLSVTAQADNPQVPGISAQSYNPDQLIAGRVPQVTETVTIVSGQGVLKRGTVLGLVTASGKYIKSLSAASDGSQNPSAILADDIDATSGDVKAGVYFTGEFNGNALILGASWTVATAKAALRGVGIYIKEGAVVAADPT